MYFTDFESFLVTLGFRYTGNFNKGNLWKYYLNRKDRGPYIAINLDTDHTFELFNYEGFKLSPFIQELIKFGYLKKHTEE